MPRSEDPPVVAPPPSSDPGEDRYRQFRLIFDEAPLGAVMWERSEGRIIEVNTTFCNMIGYSRDDLLGRTFESLLAPEGGVLDMGLAAELTERRKLVAENRFLHAAGHYVWLRLTILLIEAGSIRNTAEWSGSLVVAFAENVSVRREAEVAIVGQALHDPLTGLANRHLAFDRLRHSLANLGRGGGAVGVIYLDLDWFGVVNDRFGQVAGDQVIVEVARRLRRIIRAPDTVARLGSDEFVVVFTDQAERGSTVTADAVSHIAERVHSAIGETIHVEDDILTLSASLGVAMTRDAGEDPDSFLLAASAAMRRAKNHGRSRFELFDEELRTVAVGRLAMERDLFKAVGRDEFVQYYQPIIQLSDNRVVGMEALLRWQHGDTLLAAGEFIDIAEESEAIVPISDWCIRTACNQLAAWVEQFGPEHVPIVGLNLSGRESMATNVTERIAAIVSETGAPLDHLAVEFTETVLMQTVHSFLTGLYDLRQSGMMIVLDDFGTGFSSMAYLRRFPFDVLKIDAMFVAGLGENSENIGDIAICRAAISLAHDLGLQATAEGVERPDQLEQLREMGCDCVQGYLLSLPLSAEDATALLASSSVPTRYPTSS